MNTRRSFHALLITSALALSACQGQPDAAIGSQESALFYQREPLMHGTQIDEWRASDETHVYILNGSHQLYYGDGSSWQLVQTNVWWFDVAGGSATIWIKDLTAALYPWSLGRAVTGAPVNAIAYNVGLPKAAIEGTGVMWMSNSNNWLYSSYEPTVAIDTNVKSFYPDTNATFIDIGNDGNAWAWGVDNLGHWVRSQVDGNAIGAQEGCYGREVDGNDGNCSSYILGSDGKLWLERNAGGGHGSTPVATNVWQFEGTYANAGSYAFVLDRNEVLSRVNLGTLNSDEVDANVSNFQALLSDNDLVYVQGTDGNLWREHMSTSLP
ncbi:MAG TPA: hypothetical protein VHB97_25240 [Polyangia bacterium]|nr:hypothetical protein [Polyangia bacterium]